jgi:hypothetical protein
MRGLVTASAAGQDRDLTSSRGREVGTHDDIFAVEQCEAGMKVDQPFQHLALDLPRVVDQLLHAFPPLAFRLLATHCAHNLHVKCIMYRMKFQSGFRVDAICACRLARCDCSTRLIRKRFSAFSSVHGVTLNVTPSKMNLGLFGSIFHSIQVSKMHHAKGGSVSSDIGDGRRLLRFERATTLAPVALVSDIADCTIVNQNAHRS